MDALRIYSFAAHARADARLLILGSMPGAASLSAQQYYAHPRNSFWPIMATLCDFQADLPYPERLQQLSQHHIALWDVMATCVRSGSLDAAIRTETVVANPLGDFLSAHPWIVRIAFNGQAALTAFRRHVQPTLSAAQQRLEHIALPSTSPAHAALSVAEKCARWQAALDL
ncbi:DNA-deoxyinosine glycosylase [Sinimarinibacterium sp. NLF-5-8]|uniref:DNA-deoxyinosine glycosylase n=1 Tax=Sinimarinibacterium sp. NLF-5-8 TaxID=2698684 RepID=UPI00137BB62A|nr:DNA-deoxyinosine glycosylase [Sinimarinibacterium sp. NLF-5-8]QHS10114.1 DNA-deoxyinosine glycosylase [Sinimarinibacterium sp. NLF-5-8]